MRELERHREAIVAALTALADLSGAENRAYTGRRCADACEEIRPILNPPPETEMVEVERWAAYWPNGILMATFDTGELAADAIANDVNAYVVKLTGRFQRPKPVKVERSEKITLWPGKWSVEGIINSELPLRGVIHWQE